LPFLEFLSLLTDNKENDAPWLYAYERFDKLQPTEVGREFYREQIPKGFSRGAASK
jgi:hypothetical protein